MSTYLKPTRLGPGSRMALIAPAGPVTEERIVAAVSLCERLDLDPVLGASVRSRSGYLAGSDEARLEDLSAAMRDSTIAGIWAIRGGYGTMRLLRDIDFSPLLAQPRPLIGFSDNTALHLALDRLGLVTFHGPHAGAAFPEITQRTFRQVLFAAEPPGQLPADSGATHTTLVGGRAEGLLVGGNLAIIAALAGTPYALRGAGKIVVMEDVGEPAYRIDRMLTQLDLAGCLDGVAAIAFGRFARCATEDALPLEEILLDRVRRLGVPVVAGLPFGHVAENWCIPLGVRASLDADTGTLTILESAVT